MVHFKGQRGGPDFTNTLTSTVIAAARREKRSIDDAVSRQHTTDTSIVFLYAGFHARLRAYAASIDRPQSAADDVARIAVDYYESVASAGEQWGVRDIELRLRELIRMLYNPPNHCRTSDSPVEIYRTMKGPNIAEHANDMATRPIAYSHFDEDIFEEWLDKLWGKGSVRAYETGKNGTA